MPFGRFTMDTLMAPKSSRPESAELYLTQLLLFPTCPPSSCTSLGKADLEVSNLLYMLMVIYHCPGGFSLDTKVFIFSCDTYSRCSIKISVGLIDAPALSSFATKKHAFAKPQAGFPGALETTVLVSQLGSSEKQTHQS